MTETDLVLQNFNQVTSSPTPAIYAVFSCIKNHYRALCEILSSFLQMTGERQKILH